MLIDFLLINTQESKNLIKKKSAIQPTKQNNKNNQATKKTYNPQNL